MAWIEREEQRCVCGLVPRLKGLGGYYVLLVLLCNVKRTLNPKYGLLPSRSGLHVVDSDCQVHVDP